MKSSKTGMYEITALTSATTFSHDSHLASYDWVILWMFLPGNVVIFETILYIFLKNLGLNNNI